MSLCRKRAGVSDPEWTSLSILPGLREERGEERLGIYRHWLGGKYISKHENISENKKIFLTNTIQIKFLIKFLK